MTSCANQFCGQPGKFLCGRCFSESYCSRVCQRTAFGAHRFSCFHMPPLVHNIDQLSLQAQTFYPQVGLLSIEAASPEGQEHVVAQVDGKSEATGSATKNSVKQVASEKPPVEIEGKVIVQEEQSKQHVADNHVEDPTPTIVDLPKEQTVKKPTEIVVIKEAEVLDPVPPVNFDAGRHTVEQNMFKLPVKTVPTPVEKFVVEEHLNKNTALSKGLSTFSLNQKTLDETPRIMLQDVKVRELPAIEFNALFMDEAGNPKTFIITEFNPALPEYMDFIQKSIDNYVASIPKKPYQPRKDEVILAKFGGQYFRAVCQGIEGQQFIIRFLDYGNQISASPEDIMMIDSSLLHEIFVHTCFIENFPDLVDAKAEKIISCLEGVKMTGAKKDPITGIYASRIVGL